MITFTKRALLLLTLLCGLAASRKPAGIPDQGNSDDQLSFQTQAIWSPRINLNSDVAMVYGIDPSLLQE